MRGLRLVLVLGAAELDGVDGAVALADGDGEAVGVARVNDHVVARLGGAKGCQSRGGAEKGAEILEVYHFWATISRSSAAGKRETDDSETK